MGVACCLPPRPGTARRSKLDHIELILHFKLADGPLIAPGLSSLACSACLVDELGLVYLA